MSSRPTGAEQKIVLKAQKRSKTLREQLIEGYRARAEEDLAIANDFLWTEKEADERDDTKGRDLPS